MEQAQIVNRINRRSFLKKQKIFFLFYEEILKLFDEWFELIQKSKPQQDNWFTYLLF